MGTYRSVSVALFLILYILLNEMFVNDFSPMVIKNNSVNFLYSKIFQIIVLGNGIIFSACDTLENKNSLELLDIQVFTPLCATQLVYIYEYISSFW